MLYSVPGAGILIKLITVIHIDRIAIICHAAALLPIVLSHPAPLHCLLYVIIAASSGFAQGCSCSCDDIWYTHIHSLGKWSKHGRLQSKHSRNSKTAYDSDPSKKSEAFTPLIFYSSFILFGPGRGIVNCYIVGSFSSRSLYSLLSTCVMTVQFGSFLP